MTKTLLAVTIAAGLAHSARAEPPPPPRADDAATPRPADFAVGIGVGYSFPATLDKPNLASVRFRFPSGLTIEPRVSVRKTTVDQPGPAPAETQRELGAALSLFVPMRQRGRAELDAVASFGGDLRRADGLASENLAASWGLQVGYWWSRHLELTASATTTLYGYARFAAEPPVAATTQITSITSYGLVFEPRVALMIHLYD